MTIEAIERPADSGIVGSALLSRLAAQPADGLLALIGAFRNDPRPDKIDVGVGVYRDLDGSTPVLRAVKAAEHVLLETQASKGYLGPEGDIGFVAALRPILFGARAGDARITGLQTPGGTGALRLAAELIAAAAPGARMLVGNPTWPNHPPVFHAAGLELAGYRHFDVASQRLDFDAMMTALGDARRGDVALLHGCCHNPTGADLDLDQWRQVADVIAARGVMPLVDLAYQGLGRGLEEDAAGLRIVLDAVDEALIAYSCDKNFGVYRERVGALYALSRNEAAAAITQSNLLSVARANWSMPPDHGAAVARIVLEDEALAADWRVELEEMRTRIAGMRTLLAAADPVLAPLAGQQGMFSTLSLSPEQVARLRADHAVYMPGSGRINIAGLTPTNASRFVAALAAVREDRA